MSEPGDQVEFNVGIDVEQVERFAGQDRRADALFSAQELADCSDVADPAARRTGTWCAKESTVKALWPWVQLDPRRVTVTRSPDGRPAVAVSDWDQVAAGVRTRVSISHSGSIATAVTVAWGPPPPPPNSEAQGVVRT